MDREADATPAILAEGLTKRYPGGATAAVDGLSFAMPRGATWGLLGGNGAGKTTTIAMLLGLLVPSGGRIACLGHDMARDRFSALARMNFSSPTSRCPRGSRWRRTSGSMRICTTCPGPSGGSPSWRRSCS
ncbi:ATP-binding cassette domain-containing protein [Dankookia sp. P2]|uniref:ATP-binding cassette domain-containing protein n=1 Tax=Dankookia sp. P2 TaxID=3423955 RepID=UPI003D673F23